MSDDEKLTDEIMAELAQYEEAADARGSFETLLGANPIPAPPSLRFLEEHAAALEARAAREYKQWRRQVREDRRHAGLPEVPTQDELTAGLREVVHFFNTGEKLWEQPPSDTASVTDPRYAHYRRGPSDKHQ